MKEPVKFQRSLFHASLHHLIPIVSYDARGAGVKYSDVGVSKIANGAHGVQAEDQLGISKALTKGWRFMKKNNSRQPCVKKLLLLTQTDCAARIIQQ